MLLVSYAKICTFFFIAAPGIFAFIIMAHNYLLYLKTPFLSNSKKTKKYPQDGAVNYLPADSLAIFLIFSFILFSNKGCYIFLAISGSCGSTPIINQFYFFIVFFSVLVLKLFKVMYSGVSGLAFNNHLYVVGLLIPCFLWLLIVEDLLQFFLILELASYIFYLQFLQPTPTKTTSKSPKPLIDGIILYFWSNFFGSLLIVLSIICYYYYFNTTAFYELSFFVGQQKKLIPAAFFLIIGVFIKGGALGAQFLKVEVYKTLRLDAVINFSFISFIFYILVLWILIFNILYLTNYVYYFLITIFVMFGLVFLVAEMFKIDNIVSFFGYSTIISITLLFLILV